MVSGFSYSIKNDRELNAALKDAGRRVKDLSRAFREIARDWRKSNKTQFSLKGSGLYPPLSPKYKAWKKKKTGIRRILVLSGALKRSLTVRGGDNVAEVEKRSLTFGTKVPYSAVHQFGSAKKNIPMRKPLFIGPEAGSPDQSTGRLERFKSILKFEVERQLKKAL